MLILNVMMTGSCHQINDLNVTKLEFEVEK